MLSRIRGSSSHCRALHLEDDDDAGKMKGGGALSRLRGSSHHRALHLENEENDADFRGDAALNDEQEFASNGEIPSGFGHASGGLTKSIGGSSAKLSPKGPAEDDFINSSHNPTEQKVILDLFPPAAGASGKRASKRIASPWDNSDDRSEMTSDVIDKMLASHWEERKGQSPTQSPATKKESISTHHLTLSSSSLNSTGFIDRSNGFDMEDDDDEEGLDDGQIIEEETLASGSGHVQPLMRQRERVAIGRTHSSDTMKELFEKSLKTRPENQLPDSSSVHREDEESREGLEGSFSFIKSEEEALHQKSSPDHKDDSLAFDDVTFPDPAEQRGHNRSLTSPKKHLRNNSNGALNFEKSPFTSPSNSASCLRNFLGRGGSGLVKQASFRSTDTKQTKSTIDGGGNGEAEREVERLRGLPPPRNDSQSRIPASQEARRSLVAPGMIKSSSLSHLPQSSAQRRGTTAYGVQAPPAPTLWYDGSATPVASSRARKTLVNAPLNPLNPAPEGTKYVVPEDGVNKLSNMLLARKQARQALAENIEGSGPNLMISQSRRSITAKIERHTSASPSARRSSLGGRVSRSGSRRRIIPDDPARSPGRLSQRLPETPSRSPGRLSQRGRSKSPHSLAEAAAAAALKKRAARSPSIGRSAHRRTSSRNQSPGAGIDLIGHQAPKTPSLTSPSSPLKLTPEQIINHIRSGNFNLKLEELVLSGDGRNNSTSSGRITLEISSLVAESTTGKSTHSPPSSRVEAQALPTGMPLVGNASQSSSLGSSEKVNDEQVISPTPRRGRRPSGSDGQSPTSRRSRLSSHSSTEFDEDFQAAQAMVSTEYPKSPRRGRRQEVLENERPTESQSRSPSFSRRRLSGSHRSSSGLRNRVLEETNIQPPPPPPPPPPEDDRSTRRGRRTISSKTVGADGDEQPSAKSRSASRERKRTPSKSRQPRNSSSGGTRSRSRSKDRRSRLRKPDLAGDDDGQPEMPGNPFAAKEIASTRRPSPDLAPEPVESRRSSSGTRKPPSPGRRHERSRSDIPNPRQSSFKIASPSTRRRTSTDAGDRPLVGSSPSRSQRSSVPSIVVSPIDPIKGKMSGRMSNGNRAQSDRNLFSSQWAQDIIGGDREINDENQKQPQARLPPPAPTLPPHGRQQSSRNLP